MKTVDQLSKELKQLKSKVNKIENELQDLKHEFINPALLECEDSN